MSLNRRSELKVDPEKVRAWIDKSRRKAAEKARSRPRKGLTRKRRERPREGPLSPGEWYEAVFELARGRCAVTRLKAKSRFDRRFHRHHIIPKDRLRKHRLYMKVWDPRNGLLIVERVHANHTVGYDRIPRNALPASAWAFAAECGPWAERYLGDHYG